MKQRCKPMKNIYNQTCIFCSYEFISIFYKLPKPRATSLSQNSPQKNKKKS